MELQQLNQVMPVPGLDADMIIETEPINNDLPDWGEWLASAQFSEAIDRLGILVHFKSYALI